MSTQVEANMADDQLEDRVPKSKRFDSSQETPSPVEANIIGTFPKWLTGTFLRNGPGQFEAGEQKLNHMFDGFALMHKFDIQNGKVSYTSRFLRSDFYVKATEQKRLVYSSFGTTAFPDPCKNIFARFFSYFDFKIQPTDNCNVNVMQLGEDFYALTESTLLMKIEPETLNTVEKVDLSKYMVVHSSTAHPHTGEDGTIYGMGSTFGPRSSYNIIKFPPSDGDSQLSLNQAKILCKIPSASSLYPSYYHSFGLTENYIVFVEQPLTINILKILFSKLLGNNFTHCIDYTPTVPAKFYVIRRNDGTILHRKYTADAFFCFHHINAYEDDGHVVVDMCCYDNANVMEEAYLKNLRDEMPNRVEVLAKRFVLPLEEKIEQGRKGDNLVTLANSDASAQLQEDQSVHCVPERLSDPCGEMPRINYDKYNGKKYRYFYSLAVEDATQLLKIDTVNKTSTSWSDPFCYPSEPVFVSRPEAESEDDGVVLSSVIDLKGTGRKPYLVILDAKSFKELARAEIPADVPIGFHGIFVPKKGAAA